MPYNSPLSRFHQQIAPLWLASRIHSKSTSNGGKAGQLGEDLGHGLLQVGEMID